MSKMFKGHRKKYISNWHINTVKYRVREHRIINSQMFIELYFIKAQFSDEHHYTEVQAQVIIHIQFLFKM